MRVVLSGKNMEVLFGQAGQVHPVQQGGREGHGCAWVGGFSSGSSRSQMEFEFWRRKDCFV